MSYYSLPLTSPLRPLLCNVRLVQFLTPTHSVVSKHYWMTTDTYSKNFLCVYFSATKITKPVFISFHVHSSVLLSTEPDFQFFIWDNFLFSHCRPALSLLLNGIPSHLQIILFYIVLTEYSLFRCHTC